jgi:hypothetical protein
MHKRNIVLTAFVLAAIIAGAFIAYPKLNHFVFLRWLYAPAMLLSLVFSGSSHSPSTYAVWPSFVFNTLFYWVVLLVLYAFFCELRILYKVVHHLDDVEQDVAADKTDALVHPEKVGQSLGLQQPENVGRPVTTPDTTMNLKKFGDALKAVEKLRRKNYLLRKLDSLDLNLPPDRLAARAIKQPVQERLVKVLLKRFESKFAADISHEAADLIMTKQMPPPAAQAIPQAGKVAPVQDLSTQLESKIVDRIGADEAEALMAEVRPLLAAQAMSPVAAKIGLHKAVAVMAKVIPPLAALATPPAAAKIGSLVAAALMTRLKKEANKEATPL